MNLHRRLGLGALLGGLAAVVAGSPYRRTRGRFDVEQTARVVQSGEDHVSALQLAGWIRARKPRLRVIDVRSPQEFSNFAIPTAENMPLDVLLRTPFDPDDVLVLYSEEGAHAGQAWALLRALGVTNAWFIAGGLADWHDEVLAPVLPRDAGPEAVREFESTAELSRYFGGHPTMGERTPACPQPAAGRSAQTVPRRRRGC
ncbi:MAG TPA: rhodanese-like domain-containing protein [Telluria sp.]|nr:rhodanese-like domain-containing protein [Telluria sp.]